MRIRGRGFHWTVGTLCVQFLFEVTVGGTFFGVGFLKWWAGSWPWGLVGFWFEDGCICGDFGFLFRTFFFVDRRIDV